MDIIFAIDTSGSIGDASFQYNKAWIESVVTQQISLSARVGFTLFNTNVNVSRTVQFWSDGSLQTYSAGLYWTGGWTNTGEVINRTIAQFARDGQSERPQLFILQTDGNPCVYDNCPFSVCQYASQLQSTSIVTTIIGVGDNLEVNYVNCIANYFFDVTDYASLSTYDDNSLSNLWCPENGTSLADILGSGING